MVPSLDLSIYIVAYGDALEWTGRPLNGLLLDDGTRGILQDFLDFYGYQEELSNQLGSGRPQARAEREATAAA